MLFLLAEILNFQGSTHQYGVGSFSILLNPPFAIPPLKESATIMQQSLSALHLNTYILPLRSNVIFPSLNVIFPDKSFGDTDKQIHYSFFVIHKSTNYHYLITSK